MLDNRPCRHDGDHLHLIGGHDAHPGVANRPLRYGPGPPIVIPPYHPPGHLHLKDVGLVVCPRAVSAPGHPAGIVFLDHTQQNQHLLRLRVDDGDQHPRDSPIPEQSTTVDDSQLSADPTSSSSSTAPRVINIEPLETYGLFQNYQSFHPLSGDQDKEACTAAYHDLTNLMLSQTPEEVSLINVSSSRPKPEGPYMSDLAATDELKNKQDKIHLQWPPLKTHNKVIQCTLSLYDITLVDDLIQRANSMALEAVDLPQRDKDRLLVMSVGGNESRTGTQSKNQTFNRDKKTSSSNRYPRPRTTPSRPGAQRFPVSSGVGGRAEVARAGNRIDQLPVGGKLAHYQDHWRKLFLQHPEIVRKVSQGILIAFDDVPPSLLRYPLHLPSNDKTAGLRHAVQKLQVSQAIEEVMDTTSPGYYSRLFLVPKPDGSFRPIIDLKKLNQFLIVLSFKMETLFSIIAALQPEEWITMIDLKDAYHHILVHVNIRKYFCFVVAGVAYQFRVLPFESHGRCSVPNQYTQPNRMAHPNRNLEQSVLCLRNSPDRHVCHSGEQGHARLCFSLPGRQSMGGRRPVPILGRLRTSLCVSSGSHYPQNSPENPKISGHHGHHDCVTTSIQTMAPSSSTVEHTSSNSSPGRQPVPVCAQPQTPPISLRSTAIGSSHVEIIRDVLKSHHFPDTVVDMAANPLRDSSSNVYNSHWKAFALWANNKGILPSDLSYITLAEYLVYLFSQNKKVNTIQVHKASISSVLKLLNSPTAIQEETLHNVIRRMTILRPREQEVLPKWNLSVVLKGLMKPPFAIRGTDKNISSELLSYKTAFLVALATGARGSEPHTTWNSPLWRRGLNMHPSVWSPNSSPKISDQRSF